MTRGLRYLAIAYLLLLSMPACREKLAEDEEEQSVTLIGDGSRGDWANAQIPGGAEIRRDSGDLILSPGKPMTGALWMGNHQSLPLENFVIEMEAMRVEGNDFFAALTFPVRSLDTSLTLILGGWGGGLVGISNIDDLDASENNTSSEQHFENEQWYAVRIEYADQRLTVFIDERVVIATDLAGKRLGLKPGDISRCAPLGLATWRSTGRIRTLKISRL